MSAQAQNKSNEGRDHRFATTSSFSYTASINNALFQLWKDQPICLQDLEMPPIHALLDLVELAKIYDCIEYLQDRFVAIICTGHDFGYDKIPKTPVHFLNISAALKNEYIFLQALRHVVGRQLTSEEDKAIMGSDLVSIVTEQEQAARAKVGAVCNSLIALSDSHADDTLSYLLGRAIFRHYVQTQIKLKDPISAASYRALRKFVASPVPVSLRSLGHIGSGFEKIEAGLDESFKGHRGIQSTLADLPNTILDEDGNDIDVDYGEPMDKLFKGLRKVESGLNAAEVRDSVDDLVTAGQKMVQELFKEETSDFGYFSAITGICYPWEKESSQSVVLD